MYHISVDADKNHKILRRRWRRGRNSKQGPTEYESEHAITREV